MPVSDAFTAVLRDLRKRVIRIGRVYQGQSITLIALCRHLVENHKDPIIAYDSLQRCGSVIPT
jgi:hypothetical protein